MADNRYSKGIIFLVLGLVASSIGVFVMIDLIIGPKDRLTNLPLKISSVIIALGIFSLLVGFISLAKARKDKEIDSMSQSDLVNLFDCPRSGEKGAVYLIKLVKDQVIVKQSCPPNGTRRVTIPLRLIDQCFPDFRDNYLDVLNAEKKLR